MFGVPIRVQPFFFLVIVMLGLPQGDFTPDALLRTAIWAGVVFVSILWHELGHAWMMRRHGYAPWIELYGMGGRTGWGRGPGYPSPKVRVLVSLAGPFAGFLLGGAVWLVAFGLTALELGATNDLLEQVLTGLLWVNIGWGLVNLIPMLPWDGGAAMHGVFDATLKGRMKGKGQKVAGIMTLVVAAICGAALWVYQPTGDAFWLWFLLMISVERGVRALKPPPAAAAAPPAAPADVFAVVRKTLGDNDPATLVTTILSLNTQEAWLGHASVVRKYADTLESGRAEALEVSAWAFLMAGDPTSASEAALAMLPAHDPSVPLAVLIAIEEERFEDVIALQNGAQAHLLPPIATAYALWAAGNHDDAWALMTDRDFGHSINAALFHRGRFEDSAALAERLFEAFAHVSDAFNAACSYSRLERQAEGLRWLERAIDGGMESRAQLDDDSDLDFLRRSPDFPRIRNKASTP
ncbi:MAG: Zn-dependent protease [Polyangiales bacterium]|jgi:Zn-dependent protease